jgi:hypothetical protein
MGHEDPSRGVVARGVGSRICDMEPVEVGSGEIAVAAVSRTASSASPTGIQLTGLPALPAAADDCKSSRQKKPRPADLTAIRCSSGNWIQP